MPSSARQRSPSVDSVHRPLLDMEDPDRAERSGDLDVPGRSRPPSPVSPPKDEDLRRLQPLDLTAIMRVLTVRSAAAEEGWRYYRRLHRLTYLPPLVVSTLLSSLIMYLSLMPEAEAAAEVVISVAAGLQILGSVLDPVRLYFDLEGRERALKSLHAAYGELLADLRVRELFHNHDDPKFLAILGQVYVLLREAPAKDLLLPGSTRSRMEADLARHAPGAP